MPQQVAVLAYQFGDGFTNMIVPTSALVMGTLALGRIPYTRWLRFAAPLLVKLLIVASIVLVAAVYFGDPDMAEEVGELEEQRAAEDQTARELQVNAGSSW